MTTIKYYIVETDVGDGGMGGRDMATLATFTQERDAKFYAKGKDAYGFGDAKVREVKVEAFTSLGWTGRGV